MKLNLTDDEWKWLMHAVKSHFDFCESYHPRNGGVSLDVYIPDEDCIRSIWRKLNNYGDEVKE